MLFLLLVTLISLLLAVIMSVIAWRVAGEERRRSDARVAALAADIHDSPRVDPDFDLRRPVVESRHTGSRYSFDFAAILSSGYQSADLRAAEQAGG